METKPLSPAARAAAGYDGFGRSFAFPFSIPPLICVALRLPVPASISTTGAYFGFLSSSFNQTFFAIGFLSFIPGVNCSAIIAAPRVEDSSWIAAVGLAVSHGHIGPATRVALVGFPVSSTWTATVTVPSIPASIADWGIE